jgi:lysozyme
LKDKPLTKTEADVLFVFILSMFEKDVTNLIGKTILSQNQFNAILSFAYNIGSDIDQDDIPEGLGDSTLLRKILANSNDKTIWGEFLVWNKSNGKVLLGLTRRRNSEAHFYFKNEINYYENLK